MRLLITSGTSALAQAVMASLPARYMLRVTDRVDGPGLWAADLGHGPETDALVAGMDAIVVVGEPLPGEGTGAYVDAMTRGVYNLLWAAHQARVQRVIYLSTLRLMDAHGVEYNVTERFRPRPTTDRDLMGKHLGEYVCREFAREHKLTVVALRVGEVVDPEGAGVPPADSTWIAPQDVAAAVDAALSADVPRWSVVHVQGAQTGARYPIGDAQKVLGFVPVIDFQPR